MAYKASCVWCYQKLAEQIGATKYLHHLRRAQYGEIDVPFTGTTLSLFTTLPDGFSTDYPFRGFTIGSYLYDKNTHIKELIIGENVMESDQ